MGRVTPTASPRLLLLTLVLAASAGCASRNALVAVPTVEVPVHGVSGRPLATTETEEEPHDDGRAAGDLVSVEWHGSFWPAVLVERQGARWLVHYENYASEWDEVVAADRIRDRQRTDDETVIEPMDEDTDP